MGFRKSLDCEHSIIMEEPGMNGIILYQSKYGATKKYAQWLSEKTGFPCVETKQARLSDVREYDTSFSAEESTHRALPVYLS